MAIFKCKMCGGDLDITEGMTVCECEYCGTQQTVPRLDDEKKINLFSRANRLRAACEFDKAAGVYESIVAEFPEEAEAYWGLILCRYGIEYVDDPVTAKKIPTCHRSSFTSIFEDSDLDMVMENSDAVSRRVYREEAKAIEELRKGIIEVSAKEEPYDIFICYKETDGNGDRTIDSVIAQDIYTALTEKGYRVFFSRISLEDKLGTEYEPYIFAALNSARVMLAVGTDYEYYNAVWVKNEWSRFLMLMAGDKKRALIPCYKELDAYDMPKEFQRLQAQDMGKVGAMQDLLRGIEKILPKTAAKPRPVQAAAAQPATGSLLERVQLFLEDGKWNDAEEYCNKVLDLDARCARAYFYMVMAKKHFHDMTEVERQAVEDGFLNDPDYGKALRFADDGYRAELEQINKQVIYNFAVKRMSDAEATSLRERSSAYLRIREIFARASGFKDADAKAEECIAREKRAAAKHMAYIKSLKTMREMLPVGTISVGNTHSLGLRLDGTVVATGYNDYGACDISGWYGIAAIDSSNRHTVGLKCDGSVVAVGYNEYAQCNIGWIDIVAVSAGDDHTVGLKGNGTVVAIGNNSYGQCNVGGWQDIIAISAGDSHTVGLKRDGTVVVVGSNDDSQCNVGDWCDIVAISAGRSHTVGLKCDGTVVATGDNEDGRCEVGGWSDIVAVSAGAFHTAGLTLDGKVVAVGYNDYGQCNVSGWRDIVAVSVGDVHTVGLKRDGTVVAVGDNETGCCDVENWRGIDVRGIEAIKQDNKKLIAEIAELEKQLEGQTEIYSANKGKMLGEGAKAKKRAKKEIYRLGAQIEKIKSLIR